MTKKRIADLLKEEVEKPSDDSSAGSLDTQEVTQSATSSKAGRSTKSRTRKRSASESAAKASTAKTSTTKASASKPSTAKAASTKTATAKADGESVVAKEKAESDKKIAALTAALEKSAEQVSALQEDVGTHQERIFELKDSLKTAQSECEAKDAQIEQLTGELDTAKQTVLELTKAKEESDKVAATKAIAAEKAEKAKKVAEKAPKEEPKPSLSLRRPPYSSYKSIPEYAIQRGTPASGQNNSMINDDDIGWVD